MRNHLSRLRPGATGADTEASCRCDTRFEGDRLHLDADGCPGRGILADASDCRRTVVESLTRRDATAVHTHADGIERVYDGDAGALFTAAGRFTDAVAVHDDRLADRTKTDPLQAAAEASGRAGAVRRLAVDTGLADGGHRFDSYDDLSPAVGPAVSRSRLRTNPPNAARLRERRDLSTDAVVRVYDAVDDELGTYHVVPAEHRLEPDAAALLHRAYERLASGAEESERAPSRAVRAVAPEAAPVETLTAVVRKHARGFGVLEDLFADPEISDVFATAPVDDNPLRVRCDGEMLRTNVRLTPDGAAALASRFRRECGRAFSRASPRLDAAVSIGGRRVRVAGLTGPASDGFAFAFRAGDREAWTLAALVANGTLTASAAALLSLAVERGCAILIAGPRGAGKTTLLGSLLWELPATVRTVAIEDTPELPVAALQDGGRDVQQLSATTEGPGLTPTAALRTALRLGEGALVVGEIRGEEASVLYEAMRVGANASAVMGTIHGDGGADVRERLVSDLGVPASSFGVTDLLVTLESVATADGTERRVRVVQEVVGDGDDQRFPALFERDGDDLAATGRLDRGNAHVISTLARPTEQYADVRAALQARTTWFEELSATGRTDSEAVVRAHAERRT
ncbi:ATPase, T2SS/T4P/T4SS family [Haloarculaceae archaeon H-GB11]|nr:ATPase, T2SS/T4P/T4SS family [Haloarculaceae archaeon H-GB1-1]MEA5387712.1 ATPase, T2SS/T4P/T4SS family [Haloarculaceae archaeon H-GB11]